MIIKNDKLSILFINPNLSGIFYYIYEYWIYLNKKQINCDLFLITSVPKNTIIQKLKDKYKIVNVNFKYFYKSEYEIYHYLKNYFYFYAPYILIFDFITFRFYKNFLTKKIFYNYGNDLKSLDQKLILNDKKIITFGDKELNFKVDNHHSLSIYFNIFREYKKIKNRTFFEYKIFENFNDMNFIKRQKKFKNHSEFNKLILYKKNFYDRANRLILESAWYHKNIEIINHDTFIDSINLRFKAIKKNNIEKYNLNGSNFDHFIKSFL